MLQCYKGQMPAAGWSGSWSPVMISHHHHCDSNTAAELRCHDPAQQCTVDMDIINTSAEYRQSLALAQKIECVNK